MGGFAKDDTRVRIGNVYNNIIHIMVGVLMVNVMICDDYVDVKNWISSHHIVHWLLIKWYVTLQNYRAYSINIY